MIGAKRARMTGTRWAGLALAGTLASGVALASGTAFASSGSTASSMSGMQMTTSSSHTGFTRGWYHGHTVRFFYSKNFYCATPPASKASTKCEVGADYTQTPAPTFDPLYVLVPLGFTPPRHTLQCPTAGKCIDHPSTIDLSAVLGSSAGNVALPAHSHLVATTNTHQSEWWNVDVVGVTNLATWNKIVHDKSTKELQHLQRTSKHVTGNLTSNLFLYFSVLR